MSARRTWAALWLRLKYRLDRMGTDDGLFLSRDAGDKFERIVDGVRVLAQTFDLDGEHLWFSS